jgi:opacity protein-like surface antigen
MNKRVVGAAIVAALVGAASMAHAQQQSALSYGASGGLTLPIGDLGDFQGTGLNLQGHAFYKPSSTPFGLRGDLGFWTTGGKSINSGGITGSSQGIRWITANANAIYNFEGAKDATFVPYVIGGVGLYNANRNVGTNFGFNLGGGATFRLAGFDAFGEARFHSIFTDGNSSSIIPLSFGIRFKP